MSARAGALPYLCHACARHMTAAVLLPHAQVAARPVVAMAGTAACHSTCCLWGLRFAVMRLTATQLPEAAGWPPLHTMAGVATAACHPLLKPLCETSAAACCVGTWSYAPQVVAWPLAHLGGDTCSRPLAILTTVPYH
jgi:hypothetical protein